MKLAAIILAAGRSRRFEPGDKLLAPVDGRAMLTRTVERVAAARVADLLVVLPVGDVARRSALRDAACAPPVIVRAPRRQEDMLSFGEGQGASIAAGIGALPGACDGILIVPADMPALTTSFIDGLIAAFVADDGCRIVFPVRGDVQYPPAIFPADLAPELATLDGDAGGKRVIASHPDRVAPFVVSADDRALLDDIDTVADLMRFEASRRQR